MSGATQRTVGLVGLGEVGQIVARELQRAGNVALRCLDTRPGEITDADAARMGIPLDKDAAAFGAQVDAVIVTVIARAAPPVSEELPQHLRPGTLYSDWSTTSPAVRDEIAARCERAGARYADVAIVDTVTWVDRGIQLLASGPGATLLGPVLEGTRLEPVVVDEVRPVSSEVKLMRSVFTKGLEALLLETLAAAEAYGIRADVQRSVLRFMEEPFDRIIDLLVGSSMKHAERRAHEVHDVLDFVGANLGGAPMTAGAVALLDGLVAVNEAHDGAPPEEAAAVLERVVGAKLFASLPSGVAAG